MLNDVPTLTSTFAEQGFLILPGVLSADELTTMNGALDRDRDANDWPLKRGDGHSQDANILLRMPELDPLVEHPNLMPLVRSIVGDDVSFDEFSVMFRDSIDDQPGPAGWHRDFGRNEDRRLGLYALSLIYYLSDVTATDHCFAVAPRTHDALRDVEAGKQDPAEELDVLGPAGTAVLFHTHLIHAARLRAKSNQRRTVHIYYGHQADPQVSSHTDVPDRMRGREAAGVGAGFYAKTR